MGKNSEDGKNSGKVHQRQPHKSQGDFFSSSSFSFAPCNYMTKIYFLSRNLASENRRREFEIFKKLAPALTS